MGRVNLGLIGQRQDLFAQRVVQHRPHLLGGEPFGSDQIGPPDVADEEGVAGEHSYWFIWIFSIFRQDRDALGSVPWGLEESQPNLADIQFVAVVDLQGGKLRVCPLPVNDLRARSFGQFDVPGDEVGVRVRFDHVFDLLPVRFSFVYVLLNVALRVDNRRLPVGAQIIGSVC